MIELVGTVPVSSFQVGLAATLPGIQARIAGLQTLVQKISGSLATAATAQLNFPPRITDLALAVGTHLSLDNLTAIFNPANWGISCGPIVADLNVDIGIGSASISLVRPIVLSIGAGMDVGGLVEWSYSGPASGFGTALGSVMSRGCPLPEDREVQGLVIACEDLGVWSSFGNGFKVGSPPVGRAQLEGVLTGRELVFGLVQPLAELEFYLELLLGDAMALSANLDLALGVQIPDFQPLIDAGLNVDLGVAIESIVDIDLNIQAQIDLLLGEIQVLLDLMGSINGMLSAGGLSIWRWSGLQRSLPGDLTSALVAGLPNGSGAAANVNAIVIGCASPEGWSKFGNLVAA